MMKRRMLWGFLASLLLFAACEKTDTKSYMPAWKGFSYTPKPVHRGDSMTVTAVQAYIGHLIYHAEYTWTVSGNTFVGGTQETTPWDTTMSVSVIYDKQPQNPAFTFKVPENLATGLLSKLSVSFKAEYDYSAQGDILSDGPIYSDPDYVGSIQQQQSTNIGGKCSGTAIISVSN